MTDEQLKSLIKVFNELYKKNENEEGHSDYLCGLFDGNASAFKVVKETLENYLPSEEVIEK